VVLVILALVAVVVEVVAIYIVHRSLLPLEVLALVLKEKLMEMSTRAAGEAGQMETQVQDLEALEFV
jgi:hypothetical protein